MSERICNSQETKHYPWKGNRHLLWNSEEVDPTGRQCWSCSANWPEVVPKGGGCPSLRRGGRLQLQAALGRGSGVISITCPQRHCSQTLNKVAMSFNRLSFKKYCPLIQSKRGLTHMMPLQHLVLKTTIVSCIVLPFLPQLLWGTFNTQTITEQSG